MPSRLCTSLQFIGSKYLTYTLPDMWGEWDEGFERVNKGMEYQASDIGCEDELLHLSSKIVLQCT